MTLFNNFEQATFHWEKLATVHLQFKKTLEIFFGVRAVKKKIAFWIFVEFKFKKNPHSNAKSCITIVGVRRAKCDDEVSLHFNALF